ncbi:MAG TPA: thiolase family protein, partial [Verrucomicrobiaceae bacterium]
GGVESMSRAPHYAMDLRVGRKLGDSALLDAIMADGLSDPVLKISMAETAERIAEKFRITREAQDAFALRSQERAAKCAAAFHREITAIQTKTGVVETDEHPRPDTTRQALAQLKPVFREHGTVTAGNASGINDGVALVLLADGKSCEKHGLMPRARIVASCDVGCDPGMMGLGPIGAVQRVLEASGWDINSVDAIEINEAFAAQTLACAQELKIPDERLNQRGGAIALGHPIGASGARVLVTLLHLMEDHDLKRGIASLCVGGGMGIAMAIER